MSLVPKDNLSEKEIVLLTYFAKLPADAPLPFGRVLAEKTGYGSHGNLNKSLSKMRLLGLVAQKGLLYRNTRITEAGRERLKKEVQGSLSV